MFWLETSRLHIIEIFKLLVIRYADNLILCLFAIDWIYNIIILGSLVHVKDQLVPYKSLVSVYAFTCLAQNLTCIALLKVITSHMIWGVNTSTYSCCAILNNGSESARSTIACTYVHSQSITQEANGLKKPSPSRGSVRRLPAGSIDSKERMLLQVHNAARHMYNAVGQCPHMILRLYSNLNSVSLFYVFVLSML